MKTFGNEHVGKRITSRKDTMNQNKFRPGLKKDQEQNVFIQHPVHIIADTNLKKELAAYSAGRSI